MCVYVYTFVFVRMFDLFCSWNHIVCQNSQYVKGFGATLYSKPHTIGLTLIFTAWSSYAIAVLGIVILSVTRVLCDETKEYTADILISHERVILTPREVGGRCPFYLKFALISEWPTSIGKRRLRPIFAYNVSTATASEKYSISQIGSRQRAFQGAIDEVHTLPLTPPLVAFGRSCAL